MSTRARPSASLGPYARHILDEAAQVALRLHAGEISTEHFLVALMRDEDAGATRLVLHAFADPATLAAEILALAPGILVVASRRSLPFSMRAVRALEQARSEGVKVTPARVLSAALSELTDEARADFEGAGFSASGLAEHLAGEATEEAESDSFFATFDDDARRVLSAACRTAGGLGREAIAPAHLALAALEHDKALGERVAMSGHRARMLLVDRDEDPTPYPDRELPLDSELEGHLAAAPDRSGEADTCALFGRILEAGREELRMLFQEQKITTALHARAGTSFGDPDPPPADSPGPPR